MTGIRHTTQRQRHMTRTTDDGLINPEAKGTTVCHLFQVKHVGAHVYLVLRGRENNDVVEAGKIDLTSRVKQSGKRGKIGNELRKGAGSIFDVTFYNSTIYY